MVFLMSRSCGPVRGEFASRPKIDAERVPHLLDRFRGICDDSVSFCLDLLLTITLDVLQDGRFMGLLARASSPGWSLNVVGQRAKELKSARHSGNPERRPRPANRKRFDSTKWNCDGDECNLRINCSQMFPILPNLGKGQISNRLNLLTGGWWT
jgi:hypothetical protein